MARSQFVEYWRVPGIPKFRSLALLFTTVYVAASARGYWTSLQEERIGCTPLSISGAGPIPRDKE